MSPDKKLAKIAKIFCTERVGHDGSITSTDAYYNLVGAILDIERTGKCDKTSLKTIKRVEKQLGEIAKVLAAW